MRCLEDAAPCRGRRARDRPARRRRGAEEPLCQGEELDLLVGARRLGAAAAPRSCAGRTARACARSAARTSMRSRGTPTSGRIRGGRSWASCASSSAGARPDAARPLASTGDDATTGRAAVLGRLPVAPAGARRAARRDGRARAGRRRGPEVREVRSDDDAARERFVGSPTIRVEMAAMWQEPGSEPVGLTCRVYRLPRRADLWRLPDREDIRRRAPRRPRIKGRRPMTETDPERPPPARRRIWHCRTRPAIDAFARR